MESEWSHHGFGLLLGLVAALCVLASLLEARGWPAVTLVLVSGASSVVAFVTARAPARAVRVAVRISALSVALAVVSAISGAHVWLDAAVLLQVILLSVGMAYVLVRVVDVTQDPTNVILGALSVYGSIAILFAFIYGTLDRIQNGDFFAGHPALGHGDFLFFSFTTLTTTGYGTLVPGGEPGRMIAGLEELVGPVFLVTLVAGLAARWRPGEAVARRRAKTTR